MAEEKTQSSMKISSTMKSSTSNEADDTTSFEQILQSNGLKKTINGRASANVSHEMTTEGLLKRMQEMRENVLELVGEHINNVMSEVQQNMKASPGKKNKINKVDEYGDKRKSSEDGILPDKIFLERNSRLTELFLNIEDIRTVYNIFAVTLIILLFSNISHDFDTGVPLIGTATIRISFAKFPTVFYIWSSMICSTLGVYLTFNIWAYQRLKLRPKSIILKIWDYGWLTIYILYQILFVVLPTKAMMSEGLPIASSAIVLLEQLRIMMKSHAFVRSAAPRFLSYKPHSDVAKPSGPSFKQFSYFQVVPTLVYRDSYPRTKTINWNVVITNFVEVGLVIFYHAFIVERFIVPIFKISGKQSLDWKWYVKSILDLVIPSTLIFISGFYCLLHAWLNAWAELLRFADRLFYKDWWNCTSYRTFYRTWNVVVHDWLYTYVYKDMYEIVAPRNKTLATSAVFFISAVFHEYILAFMFGFFYPVMLIMFGGIGFAMTFVKPKVGNIFMWLTLSLGNSILLSLYAIEIYARENCSSNGRLDLLLPRSWSCW